jgi:MOSC domain-containing protein YiiM
MMISFLETGDEMDDQAPEVISIFVGKSKTLEFGSGDSVRTIQSAIAKEPVRNSILLRLEGLVGDEQADLTVHGGPDRSLLAYSLDHYRAWQGECPSHEFAQPFSWSLWFHTWF